MYLLDTDILVDVLRGKPAAAARLVTMAAGQTLYTSILNYAELVYGALRTINPDGEYPRVITLLQGLTVLPFDKDAAEVFAREKARLALRGESVSDFAMAVASIALQHDLILVSHNLGELQRVQGLKSEDWV